MKKVILVLFVLVSVLYFIWFNVTSANDSVRTMDNINSDLADLIHLTHEELYEKELHKLSFHLQQEPFLQMSQRYSRKILSSSENKDGNEIINIQETVINNDVQSSKALSYTIQRMEQLSGSFQQAKIYATVNSSDRIALRALCRRILEDYDEYSSLVICLYSETETGKALALGEKTRFTQHKINDAWLIFYSYHPVEGDYFDDKPGKYLDF